MAITVNTFLVSNDKKTISVVLDAGAGNLITGATLWTESTYKDPNNGIDLSSLLSGVDNNESFTISSTMVGIDSFEGLYFGEFTSNEPDAAIVATAPLAKYYSAMAKILAEVDLSCLSCNENFQNALLLDLYVESMKNAIQLGRFQDAITFLERVNLFTSISCDSCDSLDPVVSSAGNIVSIGVIDCILTS